MYLMREELRYSLMNIACMLGRTHATVMYGVRTIKNEMTYNKNLKREVSLAKDMLLKSLNR